MWLDKFNGGFMDNKKLFWIIALSVIFIIASALQKDKKDKPYHSDVYSSWEEERIDELECDVAYLMEKLEKKY